MEVRSLLHIQNIFDAYNPHGSGVNGWVKLKCLHLQNRAVALANPGDLVAVSADCSAAFVEYLLQTTGAVGVLPLRFRVSSDLNDYIDAQSILTGLIKDPTWSVALQRKPVLSPYMQSAAICEAARESGIAVAESDWKSAVTERLTERMNDKAIFYTQCGELGVPVPRHWVAGPEELAEHTLELLKNGIGPLYIRPTRSGGGVGNVTAERTDSAYYFQPAGKRSLSDTEFAEAIRIYVRTGYWNEFVIAEMLDIQASPGTLFYADDKRISVISHSSQVLDSDRSYMGFMYPITDGIIRSHFGTVEAWIQRLIEPWRILGYRGYGNIDWMITKAGDVFVAELNARQTAVIAPMRIASSVMALKRTSSAIVPPPLAIFAMDAVEVGRQISFEEVRSELQGKGLLWGQSECPKGVIITMPPSPEFGITTVGLMAVGDTPALAYEIHERARAALRAKEVQLLPELLI